MVKKPIPLVTTLMLSAAIASAGNHSTKGDTMSVTLATNLNNPNNLQLYNGNLYFVDTSTNPDDTIADVSAAGGAPTTIFSNLSVFTPDRGRYSGIGNYSVSSAGIFGGYGDYATTTIFSGNPNTGTTQSLVTSSYGGVYMGESAGNVYYSSNFYDINAVPATGGVPLPVANGVWVRNYTTDNNGVYFDDYNSGYLKTFNYSTQSVSTLTTALPNNPSPFANDSNNLYVNVAGGGIDAIAKTSGSPTPLVSGTVTGYAASNGNVFYTNGNTIDQYSVSAKESIPLATVSSGSVTSMATDGNWLYYSVSNGSSGAIDKVPVGVATVPVVRTPTVAPPSPSGESLWVFDRGTQSWSRSAIPSESQNTIVLTPGWRNTGLQDWPTAMAQDLAKITSSNIVTWDWQYDANSTTAGDQTPEAGVLLASALEQELPSYAGKFHFIGHSLGSLVDRQAIESLASSGISGQQIDDTILDAPEDIPLNAGTFIGLTSTNSNPIPTAGDYSHIDNYITSFGDLHSQAGNVLLEQSWANGLIGGHSYAHEWYDSSITNPGSAAGFGTNSASSTYFMQSPNPLTPLVVDQSNESILSGLIAVRNAGGGIPQLELLEIDGIRGAVQYVGNVTVSGIAKLVTIDSTPVYVTTPQFVLNGHAGSYTWVPVHIPSNASALSFDTLFQNVPAGDSLVVGIDGTVLFSLDGEYAADSSPLYSGLLDISQWKGEDKGLFFGLFPGASTEQPSFDSLVSTGNESVTIDSISFVSVPEPATLILFSILILSGLRRRRRCG